MDVNLGKFGLFAHDTKQGADEMLQLTLDPERVHSKRAPDGAIHVDSKGAER